MVATIGYNSPIKSLIKHTMVFVACGLNHKTAPLTMREKLAIPAAMQQSFLHRLVNLPAVNEALVLSTCNRTEIYCETDQPDHLIPWLAQEQQLTTHELASHTYIHPDQDGVRHTLRVASGLDSMMLGEPQILGQMKSAYQQACELGTIKQRLRYTFEYVFQTSKRIRTQSGIGQNPVSIASAAVQLIQQFFPALPSLNILLIGSGETATLVAKYLFEQGLHHFMVASRSHENAQRLAQQFSGQALTIQDIPHYLAKSDIVISATACPLPFINQSLVEQALKQRAQAPMFLLDLAIPRDIEPNVGELTSVQLYNIDDLHRMIDIGMQERVQAAHQAEQMIDEALQHYIRSYRSERANTVICEYRTQMQHLADSELSRALQKLANGQSQQLVLAELSQRLVNKLTHTTSVGLRQAAADNRVDLLDMAHYFFGQELV